MKKIYFILFILFASTIFAQDENTYCITNPDSSHIADLDAIRSDDHSSDIFHIKIYIHVLKDDRMPLMGQSIEDINRQLKYLYDTFDPYGIIFVWNGEIDYINDDIFFNDPYNEADNIMNTNNHSDGIDIYLADIERGGPSAGGFFGKVDDIGGSALVIGGSFKGGHHGGENIPSTWTKLLLHEMGHVLFLFHTFHGTASNEQGSTTCPELVDGSNAYNCGDYITDTPADRGIQWYSPSNNGEVDENCNYIYNPNDSYPDQDANGDYYQPDPTNPMAYTYPTCIVEFTPEQVKRMKNAIWYLPVLHNTILLKWSYLRTNENDCYVCQSKSFTFYTSNDINNVNVMDNTDNINVTLNTIDDNSALVTVNSNLDPDDEEGSRGSFTVGISYYDPDSYATQPIWVGLPQAVPDQTVTGPDEVGAGDIVYYKVYDYYFRLEGIEVYVWEFPEPNEPWTHFGGPPIDDPDTWNYSYFSKYVPHSTNSAGDQTGYVTVQGRNPCGLGYNGGINNIICVSNTDDPEGDTDCGSSIIPILYYPNPASSLLEVDLSLQDYKVFDIVIYDDTQTVRYSGQSTNVVKSIDASGLPDGTYYLHIYDGDEQIFNAILFINH